MPVKVYDGTNWVTVAGDGAQGPAGANATSSSIATWVKTASGGETSVSGTGDTGYGTLAYTVGQELVYLNGVLLDRGDDYTATNGTSITGLTALLANDVITVWTVNSFSVANTYTQAQSDARYPAKTGSVLQVVNATYATEVASTTSTFVDTGLTATITPTSATSKILVIVSQMGVSKSGSTRMRLKLLRNGTDILAMGDINAYTGAGDFNNIGSVTSSYLDSPATTSAVTYKTQFCSQQNVSVVYVQNYASGANESVSTITLMEIGA